MSRYKERTTLRVLVCGGREFDDWDLLCKTMLEIGCVGRGVLSELTIIEGEAKGADFLARVWAKWLGVKYEAYPADWKKHGLSAGFIRNKQMLESNPDLVVAFPGGRGTANMVSIAKEAGVPVKIVRV